MLIFSETSACTALFSHSGIMIVTGGYNEEQVKSCLTYFIAIIIEKIQPVLPGITLDVTKIRLKNRMCSNKLVLKMIDVRSLVDFLRKHHQRTRLVDDSINIALYRPFPSVNQSVSISMFFSGGVNIMGFCPLYEAEKAHQILCSFLGRFIRDDPTNMNKEQKETYLQDREKQETQIDLTKKKKKINKWDKIVKLYKQTNKYELWILKHHPDYLPTFEKDKSYYHASSGLPPLEIKEKPKPKKAKKTHARKSPYDADDELSDPTNSKKSKSQRSVW